MSKEKFTAHRYPLGHVMGFSIMGDSFSEVDIVRSRKSPRYLGIAADGSLALHLAQPRRRTSCRTAS